MVVGCAGCEGSLLMTASSISWTFCKVGSVEMIGALARKDQWTTMAFRKYCGEES